MLVYIKQIVKELISCTEIIDDSICTDSKELLAHMRALCDKEDISQQDLICLFLGGTFGAMYLEETKEHSQTSFLTRTFLSRHGFNDYFKKRSKESQEMRTLGAFLTSNLSTADYKHCYCIPFSDNKLFFPDLATHKNKVLPRHVNIDKYM